MTEERDEALWQKALERARIEATHESEIEVRAMVYYRELQRQDRSGGDKGSE